jgi:hypothetical protein
MKSCPKCDSVLDTNSTSNVDYRDYQRGRMFREGPKQIFSGIGIHVWRRSEWPSKSPHGSNFRMSFDSKSIITLLSQRYSVLPTSCNVTVWSRMKVLESESKSQNSVLNPHNIIETSQIPQKCSFFRSTFVLWFKTRNLIW